ncbi:helix-turn-helix domain-containing protein [Acinetobacter venetianus]|uniref:helix-turn-helix domain-containing protein n=1 Tax=Acinetobacter venetianus TaxID=52133 RepID=UPI003A8E9094
MGISKKQDTILLTNQEAAEILKISVKTLNNWRSARNGKIPFVKIGRGVRYKKSDLISYIDRQTISIS